MGEYIELFRSLGYPVAVSAIMFWLLNKFLGKIVTMIEQVIKNLADERKKNDEYYQKNTEKQSEIIAENTAALNKFSSLLLMFMKKVDKYDCDNNSNK